MSLKFTVTYGETVNVGNYESKRYQISREFWTGHQPLEEAFDIVKAELKSIIVRGEQR